ncbi:hypothetical protein DLAC_00686 [Tieghemostelium lacteum]|uniref:Uncharacterized protein n=1 Tax=Tieghemostelium lacteum TaxID=361077 RepID=A0A152A8T9_TIELA|nr:hypothetical protein DLAC_00686 [Tieghemostelium lacteum]|eukprot:KYR02551.1 hypothetical protein DLAC_00686 [Tieghemostelium lacteum]
MNNDVKFQKSFNNKIIRNEILRNINSIQDLFRLMLTSTNNKQLITRSLDNLDFTLDFSHPESKLLIPILKYINRFHKLTLYQPTDESLNLIENVDILEIHRSKIQHGTTINHLSNIIRNRLIIDKMFSKGIICNTKPLIKFNNSPQWSCVTLDDGFNIETHNITSLTNRITLIESLKYKASKRIDKFIRTKIFSNLKEIHLRWQEKFYEDIGFKLDDEMLKHLAEGSECGIEILKLSSWRKNITDEGLIHFKDTLKVLWLKYMYYDRVIGKSISEFTQLEELKLKRCGPILSGKIERLLRGGKLKSLSLDNDDVCLEYDSLSNLQYFRVIAHSYNETGLTPEGKRFITHYYINKMVVGEDFFSDFSNLQVFDINPDERRSWCLLTSKFITNIFSNRNPNIGPLEHLTIFNSNIDDETLQYLIGTRSIKIFINHNITSKGISFLDGIERIELRTCSKIDDNAMKYLWNAKAVSIINCPLITSEGYKQLQHVKHLTISNYKFPHNSFQYLSNIETLEVIKFEKYYGLDCDEQYPKITPKFQDDNQAVSQEIIQQYLSKIKIIKISEDPDFLSDNSIRYLISQGVRIDKHKTKEYIFYK